MCTIKYDYVLSQNSTLKRFCDRVDLNLTLLIVENFSLRRCILIVQLSSLSLPSMWHLTIEILKDLTLIQEYA